MEESSEILTIFPWYSYLTGLFIFALGIIALRRRKEEVRPRWNSLDSLCLLISVAGIFRRAGTKSGLGRRF
ncbi:Putative integral membrane protein [Salmonella enterica subsp. enterica]|uniref:Integral membrane protein n=1 Tax=Salmonella enterica I TaxID=59201 RepID=A0A3S4JH07_SALET|nr:Putative integral membrane protein [Salmonella enterica subsp. enterica]